MRIRGEGGVKEVVEKRDTGTVQLITDAYPHASAARPGGSSEDRAERLLYGRLRQRCYLRRGGGGGAGGLAG